MSESTIVTYQELAEAGPTAAFVKSAIERYKRSEMYRNAASADNYFRQRNETIRDFTRMLFTADGGQVRDFTASRLRIASNLFKRLNVQRVMYSLGKGVSFVGVGESGEDVTKAKLGDRFDDDVKQIGIYALIHGVAFPFWNLDHVDVFGASEFCPIWDEDSGALMAGIRFWRLDAFHPLTAVLYEQDGYTGFRAASADGGSLRATDEGKRPYKQTYSEVPADGLKLAVDGENYSRLPIVPVWGSDARQSTLVGMREGIDAYDLVKSGLANDVQDCAEIYWIVENAGGMGDADLARFRDRLKLTHIASVDSDDGGAATPYTQEVPYAARKEVLSQLKADIYEDFGALDVHTVAAGATNDHIDAAYQPMDEEADEFERHIREGIMDLLALQGIEDTPIFTRNRISNLKEQVEVVAMEAEWLDEETVLRKLPNVTPDEVAEILARKDAEAADRMAALPPAIAQGDGDGDGRGGDFGDQD